MKAPIMTLKHPSHIIKVKKTLKKKHLKIIHPPIYINMIKGKFELQSRDGLVQSYQDMKTTVKTELNGKENISKTLFKRL